MSADFEKIGSAGKFGLQNVVDLSCLGMTIGDQLINIGFTLYCKSIRPDLDFGFGQTCNGSAFFFDKINIPFVSIPVPTALTVTKIFGLIIKKFL